MTNEEKINHEIAATEKSIATYEQRLEAIRARQKESDAEQKPLREKAADGDTKAISKLAAMRVEAVHLEIERDAIVERVASLKDALNDLKTTKLAEARELDRWDRQRVRYAELAKRAPGLQKKAAEFVAEYNEFVAIVGEMERDNQQAAEKLEFNGKPFTYWLEALLYPRINSFLARGQGHAALEPFRDLPETVEKYLGKFFTAQPRKAA
jgi:chromosome segregation ATPase